MWYKTTSITPLLKKRETDPDVASNCRPISNLHTISKMLERLFMSCIRSHVETSTNFNRFQSVYRCAHSTETKLLRMLNDVYDTANSQSRSLVVQLHLSAAFDTLDKKTPLRWLDHTFGVRGTTHKWINSYLDGLNQFVRVGDRTSEPVPCEFGVPQGSVLGP